jgi:hypothetical protein
LGFTNWPVILLHQLGPIKFSGTIITEPSTSFLAPLPGKNGRLLRGELSHAHLLLCFVVLLYFILFILPASFYIKNPKKLESLVVVFTCLLSFC